MTTLDEAIKDAKKVKEANALPFATIWKTGNSYGFNFDAKEVGYSETQNGITRTVVKTIK